MVETRIVNTLRKSHKKTNGDSYKVKSSCTNSDAETGDLKNNTIAGIVTKQIKITELPINGFLTIDNECLEINQILSLHDISRLKFTVRNGVQKSDYGHLKFIVFKGSVTEEEFNFQIDANIINNNHYTNDNHEKISLNSSSKINQNSESIEENSFKLKNEKLERELLDFIAKRESGVVYDTKADSWVEATKSIFEEDIFENDNAKNKAL